MFENATSGARVAVVILTGALTGLSYFAYCLVTHRRFYRDLPKPPHSLFWGHLKLFGLYQAVFPPHTCISPVVAEIKREYGLGDIFYIDLWPLGPCFMVLGAPDAVAIASTGQTAQQSDVVLSFYSWSAGSNFIDATNGPLWKHLHRVIAPALTASATRAYIPFAVGEAAALHARFDALSECGGPLDFGYEVGKFPFAVAMRVFSGETLDNLQSDKLYDDSKAFVDVVGEVAYRSPTPLHAWWLRITKLRGLRNRIEIAFEQMLDRRHAGLVQLKDQGLLEKDASLPITDRMMLDAVLNSNPLDHGLRRLIVENGNGLIAAGYGTTTDALCYIFMLLYAHPKSLRKLRQEHDELFSRTLEGTVKSLQEKPAKIKQLDYTTAVIHEALRLFSVGFPIRGPLPDITSIQYEGKSYPTKNQTFALDMYNMHYDDSLFPEAKIFKPERFLGTASSINRNAYRPFERGPRACPGQALAMDEMRLALLLTARWFDFELVDHEPSETPLVPHTDLDTLIGKHAFQWTNFTAGPAGKVAMRISKVARE